MPISRSSFFANIFQRKAVDEPVEELETPSAPGEVRSPAAMSEEDREAAQMMSSLGLRARQLALSIMAKHTFQEAKKEQLICNLQDEVTARATLQGVALRISKGDYAIYPRENDSLHPWTTALCLLNVGVSMNFLLMNR